MAFADFGAGLGGAFFVEIKNVEEMLDEAVQEEEKLRKTAGFRRINPLSLWNDRTALLKAHKKVERLRELLDHPPPPPPNKPSYMGSSGSSSDLPPGVYPPIVSVVPFDEWKAAAPCFRTLVECKVYARPDLTSRVIEKLAANTFVFTSRELKGWVERADGGGFLLKMKEGKGPLLVPEPSKGAAIIRKYDPAISEEELNRQFEDKPRLAPPPKVGKTGLRTKVVVKKKELPPGMLPPQAPLRGWNKVLDPKRDEYYYYKPPPSNTFHFFQDHSKIPVTWVEPEYNKRRELAAIKIQSSARRKSVKSKELPRGRATPGSQGGLEDAAAGSLGGTVRDHGDSSPRSSYYDLVQEQRHQNSTSFFGSF